MTPAGEALPTSGLDSIHFGYDYPGCRNKADLAVKGSWGLSVFELKCFVQGADANKMKSWPAQLMRLGELVKSGEATQGVAFFTFYGYSETRTAELVSKFYPSPWNYFGPLRIFQEAPLQLVVATMPKRDGETLA